MDEACLHKTTLPGIYVVATALLCEADAKPASTFIKHRESEKKKGERTSRKIIK